LVERDLEAGEGAVLTISGPVRNGWVDENSTSGFFPMFDSTLLPSGPRREAHSGGTSRLEFHGSGTDPSFLKTSIDSFQVSHTLRTRAPSWPICTSWFGVPSALAGQFSATKVCQEKTSKSVCN
jgi:hypothetical protein